MNKKVLSLVLALVMVLTTFTSVFAAPEAKDEKKAEEPKAGEKVEKIVGKDNKIQYIIDKKFVEGYEDGSYGYDKTIKRSEITKLLVYANGDKDLAAKVQGSMQLYSDVDTKHWANGVISVGSTKGSDANGLPMLSGYPDKSFKPEKDVTYAELAKMLVVLVKKDLTKEMYDNAKWASDWMTWAAQLGILDDVTIANSNDPATRADAFTMLYNALYKMVAFKKFPVNEKLGILSGLRNNELVLNQDKEQTYKITDDTVFVNTSKSGKYANVVKVKNITNPDYYLGSLVRIMINDKNEVSHILELGNPRYMALDKAPGYIGENARWRGVADNTASTRFSSIATLKDENTKDLLSYALVEFKDSNNVKVKGIKIVNEKSAVDGYDNAGRFAVNDKTRVFVANPANNIMREVKDVNEALSLIGYRNYDGYKIPNVYVGFDDTDLNPTYQAIQTGGYKATAKVVVFNVVAKEQGGDLYRVIRDSAYNGNMTLEDTDGKLYDRNELKNLGYFPYNYGEFYDVIEIGYRAEANYDNYAIKIDHSNTKKFPIVEVTDFDKDSIRIKDYYGDTSILDIRDADIFNAKQFKDLKVGAKIQFRVENHGKENANNVAEIISILPYDMALKGALKDLIPAAQVEQNVGKLVKVEKTGNGLYIVTVDTERDLFDGAHRAGRHNYVVDEATANALDKVLAGTEVAFKVEQKHFGYAGHYKAYDFRYNDKDQTPIKPVKSNLEAYKEAVERLTEAKDVKADNYAAVDAELKALALMYDALTIDDKDSLKGSGYEDKVNEVTDAVAAEKDKAEAQKKFDDYAKAVADVKVPEQESTVDAEALTAAVQAEVDKVAKPEGLEVTATAVAPTEVKKGEANEVKVEIKTTDEKVTQKEKEANISVNVKAEAEPAPEA